MVVISGKPRRRSKRSWRPNTLRVPVPVRSALRLPCSRTSAQQVFVRRVDRHRRARHGGHRRLAGARCPGRQATARARPDWYRDQRSTSARESLPEPTVSSTGRGGQRRRGNLPGTSQAPGPRGPGHSGGTLPDRGGAAAATACRASARAPQMRHRLTCRSLADLERGTYRSPSRHIGMPRPPTSSAMLDAIGYASLDELLADAVPASIRETAATRAAAGRRPRPRSPPSCARSPPATRC